MPLRSVGERRAHPPSMNRVRSGEQVSTVPEARHARARRGGDGRRRTTAWVCSGPRPRYGRSVPRYAALLRGIAPSRPNMTNDKLRGVFEGLGYQRVGSVLASGNILFDSEESDVPELEQRIEGALSSELGITSSTIVRNQGELRTLLASDPFPDLTHGPGTYLTATFLKDPLSGRPLAGAARPDVPQSSATTARPASSWLSPTTQSLARPRRSCPGSRGPAARTSPPAPGSPFSAWSRSWRAESLRVTQLEGVNREIRSEVSQARPLSCRMGYTRQSTREW